LDVLLVKSASSTYWCREIDQKIIIVIGCIAACKELQLVLTEVVEIDQKITIVIGCIACKERS
jgi:hypothetical protein